MFRPINDPTAATPMTSHSQAIPGQDCSPPPRPARQRQSDARKLHCPHPTCKMMFSKKSDFIRHSNVTHYKFVLYGCPHCDYVNHRTDRVTVHIGIAHKDEKGRRGKNNKPVRRTNRDRRAGEEPVDPCPFCKDADFDTASDFYEHLVEQHSGPPPEPPEPGLARQEQQEQQRTPLGHAVLREAPSRPNILPAPALLSLDPEAETPAIKPEDRILLPTPADAPASNTPNRKLATAATAPKQAITPVGRLATGPKRGGSASHSATPAKRARMISKAERHGLADSPAPSRSPPSSDTGSSDLPTGGDSCMVDVDQSALTFSQIDWIRSHNEQLQNIIDDLFVADNKMGQPRPTEPEEDSALRIQTRREYQQLRYKVNLIREDGLRKIERLKESCAGVTDSCTSEPR